MTILFVLLGCASPLHLQYDYGRAYTATMDTQADLGRPSIAKSTYSLSGTEGLLLRQNVEAETTEVKSGEAETLDTK